LGDFSLCILVSLFPFLHFSTFSFQTLMLHIFGVHPIVKQQKSSPKGALPPLAPINTALPTCVMLKTISSIKIPCELTMGMKIFHTIPCSKISIHCRAMKARHPYFFWFFSNCCSVFKFFR
jgi:hypothetical protein